MSRTNARDTLSPIDKQLVFQVKYGRKVTFSTMVEDVTGYLAGWDRYSWFVLEVTEQGEVRHRVIYKGASTPLLELHKEPTFEKEPLPVLEELRRIVIPFRSKLLDEYGGSTSPRQAVTEERPR